MISRAKLKGRDLHVVLQTLMDNEQRAEGRHDVEKELGPERQNPSREWQYDWLRVRDLIPLSGAFHRSELGSPGSMT